MRGQVSSATHLCKSGQLPHVTQLPSFENNEEPPDVKVASLGEAYKEIINSVMFPMQLIKGVEYALQGLRPFIGHLQVKRTDELSRKMRFFTDQVEKSGVIPGARSGAVDPLNMDELEVQPLHTSSFIHRNQQIQLCSETS